MHMAYRRIFISIFFLIPIFALAQVRVKDGIEFKSDKKGFEIKPFGKDVIFAQSETYTFSFKPNFHIHENLYSLDTTFVLVAPWTKNHHSLESGIYSLDAKVKGIHKINKLSILCSDPKSPSLKSDTIAVSLHISYKGKAKFHKPINVTLHLSGGESQGIAWNYLSNLYTQNPNAEDCLTETPPKEVGDFVDGFVQDVHFYYELPYYFSTSYNKTYRKFCINSGPKKSQKSQFELKHIILRGL